MAGGAAALPPAQLGDALGAVVSLRLDAAALEPLLAPLASRLDEDPSLFEGACPRLAWALHRLAQLGGDGWAGLARRYTPALVAGARPHLQGMYTSDFAFLLWAASRAQGPWLWEGSPPLVQLLADTLGAQLLAAAADAQAGSRGAAAQTCRGRAARARGSGRRAGGRWGCKTCTL
ncbi:MAG: hypothetical protein J3K34DRAFT_447581 [Monoraphidium minutum]|nr:MAG: hypothetical protein J3K34DRAFT_447581 [Monoraphidium minutum]